MEKSWYSFREYYQEISIQINITLKNAIIFAYSSVNKEVLFKKEKNF